MALCRLAQNMTRMIKVEFTTFFSNKQGQQDSNKIFRFRRTYYTVNYRLFSHQEIKPDPANLG